MAWHVAWYATVRDLACCLVRNHEGGCGVQQVAVQQQWQCTPEDVEAVLVWQNQRRSSKVFLGGLYIIICLRQLVLGNHPLPLLQDAGLLSEYSSNLTFRCTLPVR